MSGDQLAKALFQLAICGGSLAVPSGLVPKEKASIRTEPTKVEDKPTTSLPSEGTEAESRVPASHMNSSDNVLFVCLVHLGP